MFHRLSFKHCTEISTEGSDRSGREHAEFYSLIGYYDCTIRPELRFQKVARAYLILFDLRHRFPIQSGWILNRDPTPADLLNANKMRAPLSIPVLALNRCVCATPDKRRSIQSRPEAIQPIPRSLRLHDKRVLYGGRP